MTHKNGIAGLLGSKVALQERIEAHLKRAPTGAALKDDYVDPTDRQNVRHRALIAAVLDACFELLLSGSLGAHSGSVAHFPIDCEGESSGTGSRLPTVSV